MPPTQIIKKTAIARGKSTEAEMLAKYMPARRTKKVDSLVTRTGSDTTSRCINAVFVRPIPKNFEGSADRYEHEVNGVNSSKDRVDNAGHQEKERQE